MTEPQLTEEYGTELKALAAEQFCEWGLDPKLLDLRNWLPETELTEEETAELAQQEQDNEA